MCRLSFFSSIILLILSQALYTVQFIKVAFSVDLSPQPFFFPFPSTPLISVYQSHCFILLAHFFPSRSLHSIPVISFPPSPSHSQPSLTSSCQGTFSTRRFPHFLPPRHFSQLASSELPTFFFHFPSHTHTWHINAYEIQVIIPSISSLLSPVTHVTHCTLSDLYTSPLFSFTFPPIVTLQALTTPQFITVTFFVLVFPSRFRHEHVTRLLSTPTHPSKSDVLFTSFSFLFSLPLIVYRHTAHFIIGNNAAKDSAKAFQIL